MLRRYGAVLASLALHGLLIFLMLNWQPEAEKRQPFQETEIIQATVIEGGLPSKPVSAPAEKVVEETPDVSESLPPEPEPPPVKEPLEPPSKTAPHIPKPDPEKIKQEEQKRQQVEDRKERLEQEKSRKKKH